MFDEYLLPLFCKEIGTSQLDMVEMKDSNKNEMIKKNQNKQSIFLRLDTDFSE